MTATWTLWVLTFAANLGISAPPIAALANFDSQADCLKAITLITDGLKTTYAPQPMTNTSIGTLFCVPGRPVNR